MRRRAGTRAGRRVVVAAVIGSIVFGEPVGRARIAAGVGVAAGVMLLAVAAT